MIRSGAKFCRVQESYYTDSHDAALVIEYRNKFEIPAIERLSVRTAMWVYIPFSEASLESFLDLCYTVCVTKVSDLPGYCFEYFDCI